MHQLVRLKTGIHFYLIGIWPLRVGNSDPVAPGVFLYVERAGADQLSTSLRVADVTRRPIQLGTRLPLVREREFFNDTTDIMGVPLMSGTRTSLRIYDLESRAGAQIMLRIWPTLPPSPTLPPAPPVPLVNEILEFSYDPSRDSCGFRFECPEGYSYKPGYIQIGDLAARWPDALGSMIDSQYGLRIELVPLTPGLAFWPMASVTENDNSYVSIYLAR